MSFKKGQTNAINKVFNCYFSDQNVAEQLFLSIWTLVAPLSDPCWTLVRSMLDPFWTLVGPMLHPFWILILQDESAEAFFIEACMDYHEL